MDRKGKRTQAIPPANTKARDHRARKVFRFMLPSNSAIYRVPCELFLYQTIRRHLNTRFLDRAVYMDAFDFGGSGLLQWRGRKTVAIGLDICLRDVPPTRSNLASPFYPSVLLSVDFN